MREIPIPDPREDLKVDPPNLGSPENKGYLILGS